MPKIKVETPSNHSAADTFAKLKVFFEEDEGLRKMDSGYTCQFDESKMSGTAKGSQFDATMQVTASGEHASVSVQVNIPFLLAPFKGKIQETLERKLGKLLS